tara:strand:- start:2375 stop:2782 length:408 start_codon:yes stop_codon:yes gene_type:complete
MVEKEIRQAPFNMALNTLESIRDWIDKIAELSIGIVGGNRIDPNELIVIKHRMVKQLIMLSTPLLESQFLEEIEEFFSAIKITKGNVRVGNGWNRNVPIYTTEIDYELDECVHGIEKALQESGHFMPGPDESSLF